MVRDIKLEDRLHANHLRALRLVGVAASELSRCVYLVGGTVRDIVIGRPITDSELDLTVVGDERAFVETLRASDPDGVQILAYSEHRTAKIQIHGITAEIAAARSDVYDPWGSLPRISLVDSIDRDLGRRDFTINAMAVSINEDGFGALIDPYLGASDCESGVLRVLHRDSLIEDPTRMMRGVRLAARLGFGFSTETRELMLRDAKRLRVFSTDSPERLFREFSLWFSIRENTAEIVQIAVELGIFEEVAPEIEFRSAASKVLVRHQRNLDEITRFAVIALGLSPTNGIAFSDRMRMPRRWRETSEAAANISLILDTISDREISNSDTFKLLAPYNVEVIEAASLAASSQAARSRLLQFLIHLRHIRPSCDGNDLLDCGIPAGPFVGQLLAELRYGRLDGSLRDKDDELDYVRGRFAIARSEKRGLCNNLPPECKSDQLREIRP